MTAVRLCPTHYHSFFHLLTRNSPSQPLVMVGTLSVAEIEDVLKKSVMGRLGCSADGETYIVPISFVYDGRAVICHTKEGKKTAMMRQNPNVCFQTEDMVNMSNWRSVVIQGTYEEVTDKSERNKAMLALLNRYLPILSSVTTHLGKYWPFKPEDTNDIDGIVFQIIIREKSGRFETSSYSPDLPD